MSNTPEHSNVPQGGAEERGQQGHDPTQGTQGEPPKNSKTGIIIAVVAVILALIVGLVWFLTSQGDDDAAPVTETTTSAAQTPSEEATESEVAQAPATTQAAPEQETPAAEEPATEEVPAADLPPTMPIQVGEFMVAADLTPTSEVTGYLRASDQFKILAAYNLDPEAEAEIAVLTDTENFGVWSCGVNEELSMNMCHAPTREHNLLLFTDRFDDAARETLTEFGDEFLTLWK